MNLFLIRHAHAVDGEHGEPDENRALSSDGRRAAMVVGRALKKSGVEITRFVSSRYVRAVETAELIAVSLEYDRRLHIDSGLEPGSRPGEMIEIIRAHADEKSLAIVGHEPSMGQLLSALVGQGGLSFSKGAVAHLQCADLKSLACKFKWVLTPKRPEQTKSLEAL